METPLASLAPDSLADELKRTLSSATLLWAVATMAVLVLRLFGVDLPYEKTLPSIILLAWIGSEISARKPPRIPIAVCEECKKVTVLPSPWLRRWWPWRRCASCGSRVHYKCAKNHLLSLFHDEKENLEKYYCTRCGVPVPPRFFSAKDFETRLKELFERMPGGDLPYYHWVYLKKIIARVPKEAKLDEEFWSALDSLVGRVPSGGFNSPGLLLSIFKKMGNEIADYWALRDELLKKRPKVDSPDLELKTVAFLLEGSGVEVEVLGKIQAEVARGLEFYRNKEDEEFRQLMGLPGGDA